MIVLIQDKLGNEVGRLRVIAGKLSASGNIPTLVGIINETKKTDLVNYMKTLPEILENSAMYKAKILDNRVITDKKRKTKNIAQGDPTNTAKDIGLPNNVFYG